MAENILTKNPDQIVFVSIRLGKTRIALKVIEEGETSLVVYPFTTIKKSWEEEIKKFRPKSEKITFVTKNSVHKYAGQYFDNLFIDEPQLCASPKQLASIKTIKYKKRVALTGTLNSKTIKKLKAIGLNVGITYSIKDAIKDQLVKDYQVFVHFIKLDDRQMMQFEMFKRKSYNTERKIYDFYTEQMNEAQENMTAALMDQNMGEYSKWTGIFKYNMGLRTNFIYNSPSLYKAARELAMKYEDEKVLIYTLRTDIADALSDKSYHSKNKEEDVLEEFKEAEKGHCAVVNCVQAGVTIRHLNRVIFHSYESNSETLYQKLGRSLLWEFEGEKSQIHLVCIENTQMESWIDQASRALEQEKIFYIIEGQTIGKLEFIKAKYPDKKLFLYDGAVVYYSHEEQDPQWGASKYYRFIGNEDKSYGLNPKKLIPL